MSFERNPQQPRLGFLPQDKMQILTALEHDWRRMCGNEVIGADGRLDPTKMHEALPYTFLLTHNGPGQGRIRVAGQRLHDMLRQDPRGKDLGAFFAAGTRDTIREMLESCLTLPAIVAVPLVAKRGFGRTSRAQLLMLPMRDADGKMTRVLGAIVTQTPWTGKPAHFELAPGAPMRCEMLEGFFPDRRRRLRDAPEYKPSPIERMTQAVKSNKALNDIRNSVPAQPTPTSPTPASSTIARVPHVKSALRDIPPLPATPVSHDAPVVPVAAPAPQHGHLRLVVDNS